MQTRAGAVGGAGNRAEEGAVTKAVLEICGQDGTMLKSMQVGFNPTEYSISRTINYENTNGISTQFSLDDLQFMKGTPARLSVNVLVDDEMNLEPFIKQYGGKTYNAVKYKGMSGQPESVKDVCRYLSEFMHYQKDSQSTPLIAFCWGEMRFIGKLMSLDTSFVLFHRDGSPARARISLNIMGEEYDYMKGSLSPSGGGGNSVKDRAAAENVLNPRSLI